ncbi:hypothetical protein R1flu_010874 [Riccia fluitans]|uniref:ABC transporter domain-containing protein n=1 Tax=Riccia fluitans TaxID=41844 RepID=A0ABD1Z694_9MARC
MEMDSVEDNRASNSPEAERSVFVDIPPDEEPGGAAASTVPVAANDIYINQFNYYRSDSKRNFWLPFPPGPLNYSEGRAVQLKASQFAKDPSSDPDRIRTYEIKVKNLFYKLPPPRQTKLAKVMGMIRNCRQRRDPFPVTPSKQKPAGADRYILRNINFEAQSGELLAIAGPSGAGKSTLLEVLAGRVKPTSPPGCMLVNDQIVDVHQFQRVSGYVMQDDALFPHLTVMETLLYSARLRLPTTVPYEEKLARVKSVIEELGLSHVATTRIGNESMRGVSGGERRRVSIGLDVIHNPAVLFLDEPTSGLDSAAAANIVEVLRVMAECHSRCVILTIHQPSVRILQLMHSFLILADGMVVHHGSLELLEIRLQAAGHQIPSQVNVLEYAIDAINSKEADAIKAMHVTGAEHQKLQDLQHGMEKTVKVDNPPNDDNDDRSSMKAWDDEEYQDYLRRAWGRKDEEDEKKITYANSGIQETVILAQRFFKNISRPKELFTARTAQALISGICLGTIFLKVRNDQAGASERIGFIAFSLSFFLSGTTEGLPIFLEERHIIMRESSRGAYRISSYAFSSVLVFAPFLLIMGLVYSIPSYWLINLNPSASGFFFFCLVLWLVLLVANSFISFFAAVSSNYIMSTSLISSCMGAFFLFSGFFISKDKIPRYWLFMHYCSLFKYPFDALLINEYDTRLETCFGFIDDSTGICTLTGRQILEEAGIHHLNKWLDVLIMLSFIIGYRLCSYLIICYKISRRRR